MIEAIKKDFYTFNALTLLILLAKLSCSIMLYLFLQTYIEKTILPNIEHERSVMMIETCNLFLITSLLYFFFPINSKEKFIKK